MRTFAKPEVQSELTSSSAHNEYFGSLFMFIVNLSSTSSAPQWLTDWAWVQLFTLIHRSKVEIQLSLQQKISTSLSWQSHVIAQVKLDGWNSTGETRQCNSLVDEKQQVKRCRWTLTRWVESAAQVETHRVKRVDPNAAGETVPQARLCMQVKRFQWSW